MGAMRIRAAALVWLAAMTGLTSFSQNAVSLEPSLSVENRFSVHFAPAIGVYYILWRGPTVTNVDQPVAMTSSASSLADPESRDTHETMFYRLEAVSMSSARDTDEDGLPDPFELALPGLLDPLLSTDAQRDFDGDGLSNAEEFQAGSDLAKKDTDGDGWFDSAEVEAATDPRGVGSHPPEMILAKVVILIELPLPLSEEVYRESDSGPYLATPILEITFP